MQFYALIRGINNMEERCMSVLMKLNDSHWLAISYLEILFSPTTSYFLGSSYVYTSSAADALFKNAWTINIPFLLRLFPSDAPSFMVSSSICPCLMRPVKRWERKWKFGTKPPVFPGGLICCMSTSRLRPQRCLYLRQLDPWCSAW